ncbi:COG4223 family protein [Azospirillum halopraeferens]|uniref:COG4223 family protein n=1 Tax=Azospirillum halopraeferens TaxID=34010 RepID=UPI00041B91BD|nr:hypothetical protein [Azospirillum halopraeferens]
MTDPIRKDDQAGPADPTSEGSKGFPEFIIAPPGVEPAASPRRPFEPAGPHRLIEPANAADVPHEAADTRSPPPPPVVPPVSRGRGGGIALLAALVAMLAAGASIAAPSLRPILAETLRHQFGDHPLIGIVTGTADTRPAGLIQLDVDTFDQRIGALAQAMTATPDGRPVAPETLEEFVTATGQNERFSGLEASLRHAEDQVLVLSKALGALETRLARVDTRADLLEGTDRSVMARLEAAEGATRDLAPKIAAVEGAAGAAAARASEAAAAGGELSGRVDAATAAADRSAGRLDGVEARLTEMAEAIRANEEGIRTNAGAVQANTDAIRTVAEAAEAAGTAGRANAEAILAAAAAAKAEVEALVQRLAALETGTGDLTGRLGAVQAALSAGDDRMGVAEQGLAAAQQSLADTRRAVDSASAELAALAERTGAMETRLERVNGGTASALLALSGRIRQALEDGESFTGEVAAVRALAGEDRSLTGAIDTLQQLASRGGPTLTLLRREFNLAAQKIIEVEEASGPAWYVRTVAGVTSQVTGWFGWVQPAMPAPGEEARTIVTEAARSFTLGRIDEAIRVLKTITGPGAASAEPWIRLAEVRVDAERALRVLSDSALAKLSAAGP